MQVKLLEKSELIQKDMFFFIENKYLNTIENIKIIHFYEDEKLISILPIEIKKKLFFNIGRLLYEPYPHFNQKIIDELIYFLKKEKLVHFLLATPNYIPFSFYPKNSSHCEFGTYRLNLKDSVDDLFKNLHSKHRNVIRKCDKENLIIIKNEQNILKECYELFKETMDRSNMEYPSFKYLNNLFLKMPENIYFSVVYYNNIPQGAIYLFYTKQRSYYLYGGSISKPFTGAMNYLHWDAINNLKLNGVQCYDFVGARINPIKGSKTEGIQRFKLRFGASLYKGYMWKYIFNKPMYFLYILILKLLSFKNGTKYNGDIIDQENNK